MPQHVLLPSGLGYALAMAVGILFGAYRWQKRAAGDERLLIIFMGALAGAFIGAKLGYVIAEGALDWERTDRWLRLATGKTVIGGLLGGYVGVEATKRLLGYAAPTSDRFAFILPIGIAMGRIGCLLHGCCLGRAGYAGVFAMRDTLGVQRWPAPLVEGGFQLFILAVMIVLQARGLLRDRLIFVYFVGYGLFRFAHEFWRETPMLTLGLTGYQWMALALVLVGLLHGWQRTLGSDATTSQGHLAVQACRL